LAQYQKSCVDILRSDLVPMAWAKYCAVSNKSEQTLAFAVAITTFPGKIISEPDSIIKLIDLTKSTLVGEEHLNVLWASVQMVNESIYQLIAIRKLNYIL
jgi:hypothetical protein